MIKVRKICNTRPKAKGDTTTIDPRIPAMLGRSTSGFHRPGSGIGGVVAGKEVVVVVSVVEVVVVVVVVVVVE